MHYNGALVYSGQSVSKKRTCKNSNPLNNTTASFPLLIFITCHTFKALLLKILTQF